MASSAACSPCLRGNHGGCTLAERCPCMTCHPPPKPLVVWQDPPPPRSANQTGLMPPQVLDTLRAHPKRWALIKEYKSKSGANGAKNLMTKGRIYGLGDPDEWESIARMRPNNTGSALYVRYLGPKTDA